MGYIYKIKNKIDNKTYIGQTTQDLESRWRNHRKNSSNCRYLKSAFKKYGVENFEFKLVCITFDNQLDDITTGDAASTLATSAGNITIDAQGNDTDIIFKGTDGSSDTTFLTIDGSDAGKLLPNNGMDLNGKELILNDKLRTVMSGCAYLKINTTQEFDKLVAQINQKQGLKVA